MKTVLVTGATDGIGLATAKLLALQGHQVIVHGRTEDKARLATGQVSMVTKNSGPFPKMVFGDLSVMKSVVGLAEQVQKLSPELDVVINNAGVYMQDRQLSQDGFEMTMAVNHLAPFLLTHHLLPNLKKRTHARVVTVSSIAHNKGHLNIEDLFFEKHFDAYGAYSASKLANVLFTRALAALTRGSSVHSYSLHPGVIDTKLLRAGFNIQGAKVEDGAQTSVFLATDASVAMSTGGYYINCKETYPSRTGSDDKLAVLLWKKTEALLKPWLN